MSDDAAFDAFLKGEGLLARQLQSLPQGAPADQLDAAILQRARDLMAQDARAPAANDAGGAAAPRMAALSWRWRVPAGIAATVLAGVFAHQAFRASEDMESRAGLPAPVMAQQRVLILQPPAAPPMAPSVELALPAPAPAFILAPPQPALMENLERRLLPDASTAQRQSPPPFRGAAQWLAEIEAMLGGGNDKELLNQWRKFRKAHPDYPVPESTSERIEALQE